MISIIIPGYNCEKTIVDTLKSLEKQKYNDFEILYIDDGSDDNSYKLVEDYSRLSANVIRLFSQKNGGPGSARNVGLSKANGEYIVFVDADDVVMPSFLEALFDGITSNLVDCCVGNYIKTTNLNDKTSISSNSLVGSYNQESVIVNFLMNNSSISLWNAIFKKSIIDNNHLRFKDNCFNGEDVYFILEYLLNSDKIAFITDIVYSFRYDSHRAKQRALNESVKKEEDFLYYPLLAAFAKKRLKEAELSLLHGKFPLIAMHELIKEAYVADSYKSFKNAIHQPDNELMRIFARAKRKYIKTSIYRKARALLFLVRTIPFIFYCMAKNKYDTFYNS